MKTTMKFLMAVTVLAAAGAAQAHGAAAPEHGGVVAEANDTSFELVAKADSIAIYVADHGHKVDTRGAAAKVTLLSGGSKTVVELAPAGDNKLEAKGAFKVGSGAKAVSSVTLAGKPAATARFEIK